MVHKQKIAITTADYRRTEQIMAHFYNDGFAYSEEELSRWATICNTANKMYSVPMIIDWALQTDSRTIKYRLPEAKTIHCDMETGLSVAVWADGTKTFVKPMDSRDASTDRKVFAVDAMAELFKKKLRGNRYSSHDRCDYLSMGIINTLSYFGIKRPFMLKTFDKWGRDSGLAMVDIKTDVFNKVVREECNELVEQRKGNPGMYLGD